MARGARFDVDYFPHPVQHGKKMAYLEKKYKNDGYAIWFKLLEALGEANYHYLDMEDTMTMMFLVERCNVSEELLLDIISDLVKLGEFDKEFYAEGVLYNQKFVESITDAYKKRANSVPTKTSLLVYLDAKGRQTSLNPVRIEEKTGQSAPETLSEDINLPTFSPKEKERIEKESKEDSDTDSAPDSNPVLEVPQPNAVGLFKTPDDLKKHLEQASSWRDVFCMNAGIKPESFPGWLRKFHLHALASGKTCLNLREYKDHFNNWIRKQDVSAPPPQNAPAAAATEIDLMQIEVGSKEWNKLSAITRHKLMEKHRQNGKK